MAVSAEGDLHEAEIVSQAIQLTLPRLPFLIVDDLHLSNEVFLSIGKTNPKVCTGPCEVFALNSMHPRNEWPCSTCIAVPVTVFALYRIVDAYLAAPAKNPRGADVIDPLEIVVVNVVWHRKRPPISHDGGARAKVIRLGHIDLPSRYKEVEAGPLDPPENVPHQKLQ